MIEKKYAAGNVEQRIYQSWIEAGAFKAGAGAKAGAEAFSIVIPPPNVTGSLHVGHALNHTLQDILIRFERMRGKDVLWQPGTDHAGIATQMVVERQLMENQQPSRRKMGRDAFVQKVWEWKEESGGIIINQLKRLGASCDWSRERFTMDPGFHDAVLKVFVDMYNKGQIYRGKRLVNWDPHFETAISDLEVENIEVNGHMWHFKYPLAEGETYTYVEKDEDGRVILTEERDYISIATTRPETMLGDGAVAVHPDDERYAPIVGKLCEIPVGPKEHRRQIPIITDDYPDPDFGSGAVKITGAHDFNDYEVAKRNDIPLYALMDTKGHMRTDGLSYEEAATKAQAIARGEKAPQDTMPINLVPEEYRGLDRFEARKKIVADITAEGLAVMTINPAFEEVKMQMMPDKVRKGEAPASEPGSVPPEFIPFVENKKIMQPFGDRSKVVIEPMLTDQWYVDTKKIVQPAIEAVKSGEIIMMPEAQKKVYFHWLENIEPWCISRQLWWGHQIPVWYDDEGKEYCAANEAEAISMAGGKPLTRDPDVLDTWFSSGLWPIGTLGWPEETDEMKRYFPTSVLITGFDIVFFWVARMIMMQKAVVGKIPFHTVFTHALVRDARGKKMSKSVGNVIDPLDLIDEFGADATRFTFAAMVAPGTDLKLSMQRVAGYRNFVTKIWNAARFLEMNECQRVAGFDPGSVLMPLNRWILGAASRTVSKVTRSLEDFRFNDASNAAYDFVWGTFCDWYIELAKPTLMGEDEAKRDETRATAAFVLDQILKLLHPFMPFVTEELWGETGKSGPARQTM
ncbi:MAG TPA: valine--tRNA ligase, partial [Devosia sp.]|nr:valine--tRNA ligase [Devosia sp.]